MNQYKSNETMKNKYIEGQIEQTLDSLRKSSDVDPGPFFAAKTIAKMKSESEVEVFVGVSMVWRVALTLLVILNVGSLYISMQMDDNVSQDAVSELSSEYFTNDEVSYQIELSL